MLEKMKKFEGIIFYIFLFCLIFALCYAWTSVDPDFWARLLQGFAVLETGSILYNDPFSYVPRHAWFDHEWGSGVIFAIIQNLFGYNGQFFLKAFLMFFSLFFVLKTIKIRGLKNTKLYNFLFFCFILYSLDISLISGIRCHFFTFLFFSIFLYILEAVRINNKNKLLYILPLLMVFWANIHGGCVSGIGLILIYGLGEFFNKKPFMKYIYTFLCTSLMLFINPYGTDYVKFLIHATTMPRPLIVEWQSIFQKTLLHLIKAKIFFVISITVFLGSLIKQIKFKEKINYTNILTILTVGFLAFSHVKHIPFFILTSTALLYDDFFFFFNKMILKIRTILNIKSETFIKKFVTIKEIVVYILVIIEIIALINIHNRVKYSKLLDSYPVKIVEFMKINNLKGKILNKFGDGSYLSYKLYPQNLIYMDGRYEEVYNDETFLYNWHFYNFIDDENIKWNDIFKVYEEPDYIILDTGDNIYYNIQCLKNYIPIFSDKEEYLYIRKDLIRKRYLIPKYPDKYYIDNYFDRIIKFNNNIKI
ncbi:hypothetical protein IJG14_06495 [bacterium]|nr:hypothetical protein [bacterium]